MATPALMAALMNGSLGNSPQGSALAGALGTMFGRGGGPPGLGLPPGIGGPPNMAELAAPPPAGPFDQMLNNLTSGKNLLVTAGIGVGKVMEKVPQIANAMVDLQQAQSENTQEAPGALPTPAEPPMQPPPQGPPGMPMPPPQGMPGPIQNALLAAALRLRAQRQQAQQQTPLAGMGPPPGMA